VPEAIGITRTTRFIYDSYFLLPDGLIEESVGVMRIVLHGGPYFTIGRTFEMAFSLTI